MNCKHKCDTYVHVLREYQTRPQKPGILNLTHTPLVFLLLYCFMPQTNPKPGYARTKYKGIRIGYKTA